MADCELMNVVSVGGNPVSAFLSWRLQATQACDVTLVWKSGFDRVEKYGITFRYVNSVCEPLRTSNISGYSSPIFGNERFKPRHGRSITLLYYVRPTRD